MKSIALILKTTLYLLILSVIFSSNISAQKSLNQLNPKLLQTLRLDLTKTQSQLNH